MDPSRQQERLAELQSQHAYHTQKLRCIEQEMQILQSPPNNQPMMYIYALLNPLDAGDASDDDDDDAPRRRRRQRPTTDLKAQLDRLARRRDAFLDRAIQLACGTKQHVHMIISDFATGPWIATAIRETLGEEPVPVLIEGRRTLSEFITGLLHEREIDSAYQNGLLSVYYQQSGSMPSTVANTRHWILNSVKPRRLVELFLSTYDRVPQFSPQLFVAFTEFMDSRRPGFTATLDPDVSKETWRRAFAAVIRERASAGYAPP